VIRRRGLIWDNKFHKINPINKLILGKVISHRSHFKEIKILRLFKNMTRWLSIIVFETHLEKLSRMISSAYKAGKTPRKISSKKEKKSNHINILENSVKALSKKIIYQQIKEYLIKAPIF